MAAGHNALRRLDPGQQHALFRRPGTNGLFRSVGRLAWVRYSIIAFPTSFAGYPFLHILFASRSLLAELLDMVHRAPSSPMRFWRSCWPMRQQQSSLIASPSTLPAMDSECTPTAWLV